MLKNYLIIRLPLIDILACLKAELFLFYLISINTGNSLKPSSKVSVAVK